MSNTVIQVENLWKQYRLGIINHHTLTRDLQSWWARVGGKEDPNSPLASSFSSNTKTEDRFWALQDVSFEVKQGDILGIIGRNGAGKSTLLKILSQVTAPTRGEVRYKGRIASLLEVGTGFHPELTGRENIFLNGAILGMSKADIRKKFDEIVAFAEVEKFIDTPVKRYSSGMYVRLAFAVAAHLEPEILIIDEVLAVGDAQFQKKCLVKMENVGKEGRTVLFVSHNLAAVEKLCRRAVVLENSLIRFAGTQTAAITEYQRNLAGNQVSLKDRTDRNGTGELRVVAIEFRDVEGHKIDSVMCGQDFDILLHFITSPHSRRRHLVASVSVKTQSDVPVFLHHNRMTGTEFSDLPTQGAFVCRIQKTPLTPSIYKIGFSVIIDNEYLDGIGDAAELVVIAGDFFSSGEVPPSSHGFCLVSGNWSLEQ
jgi:lipopolysaccharide transport system ATP-binding protein